MNATELADWLDEEVRTEWGNIPCNGRIDFDRLRMIVTALRGFQEYAEDMERRLIRRVDEVNEKDVAIKALSSKLQALQSEHDALIHDHDRAMDREMLTLNELESTKVKLEASEGDFREDSRYLFTKAELIDTIKALESRLDRARLLSHSWADTPFTTMDVSTMKTLGGEMLRVLGEKWIAESSPGVVERHTPVCDHRAPTTHTTGESVMRCGQCGTVVAQVSE